jgi:hypothetical protein
MFPGLDPLHRSDPKRVQRGVIQLAAIVLAHGPFDHETDVNSPY